MDICPGLSNLMNHVDTLASQSLKNEEYLIDVPFTLGVVEKAVKRLKKRKDPGPDGLMAEHLQGGGV